MNVEDQIEEAGAALAARNLAQVDGAREPAGEQRRPHA